MLFPVGYGREELDFARLRARFEPRMHPEFARRVFAMLYDAAGLVGIGSGWRSTEQQLINWLRDPNGFAPPGLSFHEEQLFPLTGSVYAALDMVGTDQNRDGTRSNIEHNAAWNWMKANAHRYGLVTFWNVNNEPWHIQMILTDRNGRQLNSVRAWKAAGCPEPTVWKLPSRGPVLPPPTPAPTPAPAPTPSNWMDKIVQALPTVRRGSTGFAVKLLQASLEAHAPSYAMPVDGNFGPTTENYVKWFQGTKGLTTDGIVGPKTWTAVLGG